MNPTLAARINRFDLIGIPVDPYGGSSGMAQAGAGAMGSFPGVQLGGSLEGRATAGVLLASLLVVAGFYLWTRGVQS